MKGEVDKKFLELNWSEIAEDKAKIVKLLLKN